GRHRALQLGVGAGRKDRRRARDDHQAHGGVVAQLAEGAAKLGQHGVAQRVAAIGTIQGHRGHGAVAVEADVVAHARRDIIRASMSEQIVWRPTAEYVERAKITRLMRRLGPGDRVGIFLPMSPEAAIATLAVVRVGAVYTPCFSGFGGQAVASRLQDSEAKVLITADGFFRRGQVVKMKETADEAVALSPSV